MNIDLLGDMDGIFLESGFEEDIAYNGATIPAIIDRGDTMMLGRNGFSGRGGADQPKYKVTIIVSKTDVPAPVLQADKITLSHHGRTSDVLRVSAIVIEDAGSFTLGLT